MSLDLVMATILSKQRQLCAEILPFTSWIPLWRHGRFGIQDVGSLFSFQSHSNDQYISWTLASNRCHHHQLTPDRLPEEQLISNTPDSLKHHTTMANYPQRSASLEVLVSPRIVRVGNEASMDDSDSSYSIIGQDRKYHARRENFLQYFKRQVEKLRLLKRRTFSGRSSYAQIDRLPQSPERARNAYHRHCFCMSDLYLPVYVDNLPYHWRLVCS